MRGTVRAVPVFGSDGSSGKGLLGMIISVELNRKARLRFRHRLLNNCQQLKKGVFGKGSFRNLCAELCFVFSVF